MIGWGFKKKTEAVEQEPQIEGFDSFEMRLGDMMRGERATLGKSLLDVQRELRIKAAYIAAIESADPSAFDTPGFISGYVRSYSRYLGMDPDETFEQFCVESGFAPAHGMSDAASSIRIKRVPAESEADPITNPTTPFAPESDPIFSNVEPRALGSIAVLLLIIAGLGYGGWAVLNEIQRVQFAPLDQTPEVAALIDPLAAGTAPVIAAASDDRPATEAFDRLYRPAALDTPVMVARDAPISTLDPRVRAGVAAPIEPVVAEAADPVMPQVTETPDPGVTLLAVRPVWVRVRAADGSVLLEKILDAGEEYTIPESETPPSLRAGNSGSLFFRVAGTVYGPAGPGTSTARNVALGVDALRDTYQVADLQSDSALADYVTVAEVTQP